MKKVLFITYYWPPSGGAGVQRALKFVKYLSEFGVDPIVLTVDPAKASYPAEDPSLMRDVPAGVKVVRTGSFEPLRLLAAVGGRNAVPHAGFAGVRKEGVMQRVMRWVRGNVLLPDARRGWVPHAFKAAVRLIEDEHIDTVLISSPPHSSQLIGLKLKERFPDLRWMADLRDPWTDIYYARDFHKGAWAERRDAAYEARAMSSADRVIFIGPALRSSFVSRYGTALQAKSEVIPNGYDEPDVMPVAGLRPATDRFRIAYVGTMAASYDPRVLFRALNEVRRSAPRPLELRFVGSTSPEIRTMADDAGLADICTWIPTVPHDDALREMALADVLLVVIPDSPDARRIITGKIFECIGVQRTVLGIGPVDGDAAAIIREWGAGRMFERTQHAELAGWLMDLLRSGGPIGDPAARRKYQRRAQAGRLASLIKAGSTGQDQQPG